MIVRAAFAAAAVGFLVSACMPVHTFQEPIGWQVRGASLEGDIDGDGRAEEVAVEETAPQSCRLRLRARGARGTVATPIELDSCEAKPPQHHPSVIGLAAIDQRPGLEIVVELGCGAHTCMGTIFGAEGRRLREWLIPPNVVGYGGSVGTGSHAIDCADEQGVVITTTLDHRRSLLFRTWYRADGYSLKPVRANRAKARQQQGLPGIGGPFAGCTVVAPED